MRFNEFLIEEIRNLANWSSFVGQTDDHMSLLTVRETLDFAWRCRKEARHSDKAVHTKNIELYGEQVLMKRSQYISLVISSLFLGGK